MKRQIGDQAVLSESILVKPRVPLVVASSLHLPREAFSSVSWDDHAGLLSTGGSKGWTWWIMDHHVITRSVHTIGDKK